MPGLLYAGSAGLAQALAALNSNQVPAALLPSAERTLLIAGSQHPVTKLQLETLACAQFDGVRVLRLRLSFGAAARIRSACRSFAPQALVLTGGDTAVLAVRALDAHSFILQGELAPGIPWGMVQGGDRTRLHRRHQVRRFRLAHGASTKFSPRFEVQHEQARTHRHQHRRPRRHRRRDCPQGSSAIHPSPRSRSGF